MPTCMEKPVDMMMVKILAVVFVSCLWMDCSSQLQTYFISECVSTLCGRKRWFPNISSPSYQARSSSERQAVNFQVQGKIIVRWSDEV